MYVRDGEVWYGDSPVDIAYRDYEVRDLIALEQEERVDVEPLRVLFRENRIISSLAGEFDHKSSWELLTDPKFGKYFNPDERQVFKRHVLWTRLVYDRRTMLPDGSTGDLLEFVRDEREILVLKPNRSYGGDRVILGHLITQPEWEAEIELALKDPVNPWVVQRLAAIPVSEFPVLDGDGTVDVEPFYLVMGFAPTKYGLAILGRASQKQVVNVAQRGGMCGVLIGRPVGRLIGPDAVSQGLGTRG